MVEYAFFGFFGGSNEIRYSYSYQQKTTCFDKSFFVGLQAPPLTKTFAFADNLRIPPAERAVPPRSA